MSNTVLLLIGCCCVLLCIFVSMGGYLYKVKGIRPRYYNLVMCAFSNTPLVGTWKSESKSDPYLLIVTLVDTIYTFATKSPDGLISTRFTGSLIEGKVDIPINKALPEGGKAVLKDLTLTLTNNKDGSGNVYTKIGC